MTVNTANSFLGTVNSHRERQKGTKRIKEMFTRTEVTLFPLPNPNLLLASEFRKAFVKVAANNRTPEK